MGVRKDGVTIVDDVGGGGGAAVDIVSPIGPNVSADSVSVTLATDETPISVSSTPSPDIVVTGTLNAPLDTVSVTIPEGYNSVIAKIRWRSGYVLYASIDGVYIDYAICLEDLNNGLPKTISFSSFTPTIPIPPNYADLFFIFAVASGKTLSIEASVLGTATSVELIASVSAPNQLPATYADLVSALQSVTITGTQPIGGALVSNGLLVAALDDVTGLADSLHLSSGNLKIQQEGLGNVNIYGDIDIVDQLSLPFTNPLAVAIVNNTGGSQISDSDPFPIKISDGTNIAEVKAGSSSATYNTRALAVTSRDLVGNGESIGTGSGKGLPVMGRDVGNFFRYLPIFNTGYGTGEIPTSETVHVREVGLGLKNRTSSPLTINALYPAANSFIDIGFYGYNGEAVYFAVTDNSFVGTLELYVAPLGAGFTSLAKAINLRTGIASSTITPGDYYAIPSGINDYNLRCTAYTSGSVGITYYSSTKPSAVSALVAGDLNSLALVATPEEDLELTDGDSSNLSQTQQGYLRSLSAGLVNDAPQNYYPEDVKPLSLTSDGRLRVSSVDSLMDKVWGDIKSPWDNQYQDMSWGGY